MDLNQMNNSLKDEDNTLVIHPDDNYLYEECVDLTTLGRSHTAMDNWVQSFND